MDPESVLWEETVEAGASWSHVLKRGTVLRMTDVQGGANVGALFYNFECPVERYNMADTLKAQHIARLTAGFVLYSDMGRILCSVVGDTVGWHDPLGGCSNAAMVDAKYGESRYRGGAQRPATATAATASPWSNSPSGGSARVISFPTWNFFSSRQRRRRRRHADFRSGNSAAGSYVELRAEMNVLTILNTCMHPLDPSPPYAPKPVHLAILRGAPAGPGDPCRCSSRPENGRGFTLTERYFV